MKNNNSNSKNELSHSISLSNSFGLENRIINDMISDINKKKESAIFKRLDDLDININIEDEKNRRFKRILIEQKGNEETYWYNNGSTEGIRIITFITTPSEFDINNPTNTLSCKLSFY